MVGPEKMRVHPLLFVLGENLIILRLILIHLLQMI